ncbi:alcohol oxidase-like protein [Moniliophthora roreri]|nr:alcohol oxidase-like protein [Moniliophthora roreri]
MVPRSLPDIPGSSSASVTGTGGTVLSEIVDHLYVSPEINYSNSNASAIKTFRVLTSYQLSSHQTLPSPLFSHCVRYSKFPSKTVPIKELFGDSPTVIL